MRPPCGRSNLWGHVSAGNRVVGCFTGEGKPTPLVPSGRRVAYVAGVADSRECVAPVWPSFQIWGDARLGSPWSLTAIIRKLPGRMVRGLGPYGRDGAA